MCLIQVCLLFSVDLLLLISINWVITCNYTRSDYQFWVVVNWVCALQSVNSAAPYPTHVPRRISDCMAITINITTEGNTLCVGSGILEPDILDALSSGVQLGQSGTRQILSVPNRSTSEAVSAFLFDCCYLSMKNFCHEISLQITTGWCKLKHLDTNLRYLRSTCVFGTKFCSFV